MPNSHVKTGVPSEEGTVSEPVFNFDKAGFTDLLIILITLVGVKQAVLTQSTMYAGPASTVTAMLVGTYLLRRRGLGWRDMGFRWPESWLRTIGLGFAVFAAIVLASGFFGWAADQLFEDVGTSGRFDHVEGNLMAYIGVMILVWTHAAFFEELLFRAFIINKTSTTMGGGRMADVIAVVLAAAFFGYRHAHYQGWHGAVQTGGIGLVLGTLYVWFGRKNILPLVLAHGAINSIGMTSRFLGLKGD